MKQTIRRKLFVLAFLMLAISISANAQLFKELKLSEYLEIVRKNNLEYASQRLSIDIADAEIISASVFNNPSLGLGYYNSELNNMQMGYGGIVEISQTFSPGRRSAAMKLAHTSKEISAMLLADFMRILQQDATLTWLETVRLREQYELRKSSYKDQIKMMESDSIRRAHESIRDLDALQNRVETGNLYSEILDIEGELNALYQEISNYCGTGGNDTVYIPERKNIWNNRSYNLNEIINTAINNRVDIIAARKEIDLSKYALNAAKNERIPEFDIFIGYGVNAEVKNELAPAPKHNGIEFGISFPIPLFNRGKGEILAARANEREAEIRYRQAQMQVRSEVVNAFNAYLFADKKMKLFTSGLVKSAKEVLEARREEYYNGEVHLIEVMDAQRSYDEILLSFYSTIYEKSKALVMLESSIGVWNIESVGPF
ncbi:MAG: TolC family protein [Bacteroidales bacterium]|nr:TolC family protein [Bacteroidales bacterium]